jgi:hypothetical protein
MCQPASVCVRLYCQQQLPPLLLYLSLTYLSLAITIAITITIAIAMPPRKSTSRSSRPSQAAVSDAASQPVASSSKTTLDAIPPLSVPESITPEYVYAPPARPTLTEAERETLVHEVGSLLGRSSQWLRCDWGD